VILSHDTPPSYLEQCIAEQMRHELASTRLEVVLVPSPVEHWPTDRQRRVVCERNPAWYRELCRQYPSRRTRPRRRAKPDTAIKRAHTLRALAEIQDGRVEAETPLPKPEIEPLETAVAPFAVEHSENLPTFLDREYRPQRPGPGDALAALAALVNNEQLRIKGSVKLNLEIEFGE
jgi:hypothetical protein